MKSIAALSTLVACVVAQAPGYFNVIAARSASPIHFLPLQANGGKFFLGGTPSGYCPSTLGNETCAHYPGNTTTLVGGNVSLSLGVVVPGGQQVYVGPDGALSYTQAHSASIPAGSVQTGWTKEERSDGSGLGSLSFEGGLVACPKNETTQPWQVYGEIANFTAPSTECLGFSAVTYNATDAAAWQY